MRKAVLGLTAFLVIAAGNTVLAKARFMPKGELIETAEIIAVVAVTKTNEASVKGEHWTYRQAADALTVQTLKGELPMHFVIHAKKDFICACATYESNARYLVFLRREGKLFTTVNHQLGQFKVTEKKVKWYVDDRSLGLSDQSLNDVMKNIEAVAANEVKKVALVVPATEAEDESIDEIIKDLFSDDGQVRIAATHKLEGDRTYFVFIEVQRLSYDRVDVLTWIAPRNESCGDGEIDGSVKFVIAHCKSLPLSRLNDTDFGCGRNDPC
jgi:hypothetical protein